MTGIFQPLFQSLKAGFGNGAQVHEANPLVLATPLSALGQEGFAVPGILNVLVAFYIAALIFGPLLGSFITEPAAMTLLALILKRRYFDRDIIR